MSELKFIGTAANKVPVNGMLSKHAFTEKILSEDVYTKNTGIGGSVRPLTEKIYETISVKDFGAVGNGTTNDYLAFQNAINALPEEGGVIGVPEGTYLINTTPNEGTKSIFWNISTGATFSGTGTGVGKFPYMVSNPAQMAVGPYIRSKTNRKSEHANGGIAALNVEMIQPATYVGQSVGAYIGAVGSNSATNANVWALNTLIRAESGSGGVYQCIEVDVDCFSETALVKGISISGAGPSKPDVALEVTRSTQPWNKGISLQNTVIGIEILQGALNQTTVGIAINNPADQSNVVISGKLLQNASEGIFLQRFTDTSPSGNFLKFVNTANTQTIYSVDVSGNLNTMGTITSTAVISGNNIQASGNPTLAPQDTLRISSLVETTVGTSGDAAALPANPHRYLVVNQSGVNYKIPLYRA